jgi:hypothetical protein
MGPSNWWANVWVQIFVNLLKKVYAFIFPTLLPNFGLPPNIIGRVASKLAPGAVLDIPTPRGLSRVCIPAQHKGDTDRHAQTTTELTMSS